MTEYHYGQRVRVRPLNIEKVPVGTPFVGTIVRCDHGVPGDAPLYNVRPDDEALLDRMTRDVLVDGVLVTFNDELELLQ